MADDKRYNLLYKPELKPDRTYRSEAEFTQPTTPAVEINIPPEETPEDIVEQLKELEELVPGLPDGLKFVGEIVTPLRQRAEVIVAEQELLKDIPQEETVGPQPGTIVTPQDISNNIRIGTNVTDYTPMDESVPELFPPPSNIVINVETPKTLVQIAQENYAKDQIDLQKYYLQNMRLALQKYFQHQLALTAELGLSTIDMLTKKYDGTQVTGVGVNQQHLHDTIIRSQLQREQKARYFNKLANTEQTLMHMRQWNAAEKLRERYYDEAYGDSEKFVDSEANAILRQNRSEYDAGYKASLYNMYKYLDSSVAMTNDILDHTLLESKAKAKLLKEGVDIFKQKEYSSGSAVQTTQAQTAEQAKAAEEFNKQSTSTAKPTAKDIDKATGVTDPADEAIYGLAPNGGHWSMNDIKYLNSVDSEAYNSTPQGIENIKIQLSLSPKYAANEKSDNSNSNNVTKVKNASATNATNVVGDTSNSKVGAVTVDATGTVQTSEQQANEIKRQVAEESGVSNPTVKERSTTTGNTEKWDMIDGFDVYVMRPAKNAVSVRIVHKETMSIVAAWRRTSSRNTSFESIWAGCSSNSNFKMDKVALRTVYDRVSSIPLS